MRYLVRIGDGIEVVDVVAALTRNEIGEPWEATLVGYEGGDPIGWGDTPEEAIEDLKAEIEWRSETA